LRKEEIKTHANSSEGVKGGPQTENVSFGHIEANEMQANNLSKKTRNHIKSTESKTFDEVDVAALDSERKMTT